MDSIIASLRPRDYQYLSFNICLSSGEAVGLLQNRRGMTFRGLLCFFKIGFSVDQLSDVSTGYQSVS